MTELLYNNENMDPSKLLREKMFVSHYSKDALHLLSHMILTNPKQRPTAQTCLKHPWFNEFRVKIDQ
jgi:serine/threonine protein kinase